MITARSLSFCHGSRLKNIATNLKTSVYLNTLLSCGKTLGLCCGSLNYCCNQRSLSEKGWSDNVFWVTPGPFVSSNNVFFIGQMLNSATVCTEMEIYFIFPFFCVRMKYLANFLQVFFLYLPIQSSSVETMGSQYLIKVVNKRRKLPSKGCPLLKTNWVHEKKILAYFVWTSEESVCTAETTARKSIFVDICLSWITVKRKAA